MRKHHCTSTLPNAIYNNTYYYKTVATTAATAFNDITATKGLLRSPKQQKLQSLLISHHWNMRTMTTPPVATTTTTINNNGNNNNNNNNNNKNGEGTTVVPMPLGAEKRDDTNKDRPVEAPLPSSPTQARSSGTTMARGRHSFRFPKFSLRSPSAVSGSATATAFNNNSPRNGDNNNSLGTQLASSTPTKSSGTSSSTAAAAKRLRSFPALLRRRHSMPETTTAAATTTMTMTNNNAKNVPSSDSSSTSNSTHSTTDYIKVVPLQNNRNTTRRRTMMKDDEQQPGVVVGNSSLLSASSSSPQEAATATLLPQNSTDGDHLALVPVRGQQQDHGSQRSNSSSEDAQYSSSSCAYLEMVCGGRHEQQLLHQAAKAAMHQQHQQQAILPDDPTVQDSIECVFASQLAAGMELWSSDSNDSHTSSSSQGDHHQQQGEQNNRRGSHHLHSSNTSHRSVYEEEPINAPTEAELPSPAPLMQSRLKSRTPLPSMGLTKALIPSKRRSHPSNNTKNNNESVTNANAKHHQRSPKNTQQQQQHCQHHHHNPNHHNNLRFASDDANDDGNNEEMNFNKHTSSRTSPKRSQKGYSQQQQQHTPTTKRVHIGTFDPRTDRLMNVAETDHNLMEEDPVVHVAVHTGTTGHMGSPSSPSSLTPCYCQTHTAPSVPVDYWPQAPLLLRPTPGVGMHVKGVRFSCSSPSDHFWKPSDGGWWLTPLYEMAGHEAPSLPPNAPSMCSQCCALPINNGNEEIGKALVTDFETPLFDGTLLLRLRHVDGGATCATHDPALEDYNDEKGYFAGLNRRYQVVIRGKFKQEVPLTGLVSGFVMDRPYGKLPPKWIMKGAVKVLSFFAPQLEVQMDNPRPKTMAPLGSTPQALIVEDIGPNDTLPLLDATIEEPRSAKTSLLNETYPGTSSLQRARGRKKAFDKLYAVKSKRPMAKTISGSHETYYTFEFLQHLVNFQEFAVELGNLLGSIALAPMLAGHPIPIMAMTKEKEQKIWSFDIWHEKLVESAERYDKTQHEKKKQISKGQ